jgi:SPP1 family predicted phage head-tail adaptor
MIRAGDLDRQLVVRKRVQAGTDDHGAAVYDWPPQDPVFAKRDDASDGERMRAEGIGSTLMTRFIVRDDPEIRALTADDRVEEVDGLLYDVLGVKEPKGYHRGEALEITGKAALTDG